MTDLRGALRAHPFLADLPDRILAPLDRCTSEASYEIGAFLMREGAPATTFFLLQTGSVSLEVHIPGRSALRVETAGAGALLGLSWLFPGSLVHLDARAVEPSTALAMDGEGVRAAMDADPEVGYALSKRFMRVMFERLERVRLQRLDVYRASP